MRKWRVANSLERLLFQVNAKYPGRSKVADGGIGDAEHATRNSDHNPWVIDAHGLGVVTARDVTNDPKGAPNSRELAEKLVASRDPRIKYVISNGQICSSIVSPWKWRTYKGKNGHFHHVHVSVRPRPELYDSTAEWKI